MMQTLKWIVVVAGSFAVSATPSCSPSTSSAAATSSDPRAVTQAFVEASQANDKQRFTSFLTAAAKKGLASGSGFEIDAAKFGDFEVEKATVAGETAEVPVRTRKDGQERTVKVLLRRESDKWSIYALRAAMKPGGPEMTINFEQIGDVTNAIGEAIASEIQKAFEESKREQERKTIARNRDYYESLSAMSRGEFEAGWTNAMDYRGQLRDAALSELAAAIGLELDAGEYQELLQSSVSSDVRGLSQLEAIETICGELDLTPQYPSAEAKAGIVRVPSGSGRGAVRTAAPALDTITLTRGPRPRPIAFAGPFLVSVSDLEEFAPQPRGTATVEVSAYGLNSGILGLIEQIGETVTFGRIIDSKAHSLKATEDVRFHGGGLVEDGAYQNTTRIQLRNLLRDVEAIDTLEGTHRISVPLAIESAEFSTLKKGDTQKVGQFRFTVTQTGTFTAFNVEGPESQLDDLSVRFRAFDASGSELSIFASSVSMWGPTKAQASLQTDRATAKLHMKLVTESELIDYAFTLRQIPLLRFGEMPEKLEQLTFDGFDMPLEVEFVAFHKEENQFPKARLRCVNRSNKAIVAAQVRFVYRGAQGEELKDFPHTLNGVVTTDGPQLLVEANAHAEIATTAFFLPENAVDLEGRVESVEFVDGTKWAAKQ